MSEPQALDALALTAELFKLPTLTASSPAHLGPVQRALANAVASGQSADQLAHDLSGPRGWARAELAKKPATAAAIAPAATPAEVKEQAATPAWIAAAVPVALKDTVTTRVAVLDHEPTALGGLELPGWARALKPSAVYGPVTATGADLPLTTPKWILIFHFTKTVQFVRGTEVLCVVPLSVFQKASATETSIVAGSVWLAAHPFSASAPADSFAGMIVQGGTILCDQPLVLTGTTVTVTAGATLNVHLRPAPTPAGPAGFPASIQAPEMLTMTFPPTGQATIAFDQCGGTLFGETIDCNTAQLSVLYNAQLKLLYVQGHSTTALFTPTALPGKLLTLSGSAPILSAGWAISVSESATPATLGTAISSGDFAIVFGAGISSQWTGLSRIEPIALGTVAAQNNALLVYALSGSAPGVLLRQTFELWDDQDATPGSGLRCELLTSRGGGQPLTYALTNNTETLLLGAGLEARIDRPLLATGERVPAIFLEAAVALIHNNAGNRLIVTSTTPLITTGPNQQLAVYPLGLDNALLEVGQPTAFSLTARADANFNGADNGLLLLGFSYKLIELYLPDPYTGSVAGGLSRTPSAESPQGVLSVRGTLAAEVLWFTTAQVSFRLEDTAHAHPSAPPATEAGSDAVPPHSYYFPDPFVPNAPEVASKADTALKPAKAAKTETAVSPKDVRSPQPKPPHPLPVMLGGATLLDVSTRASQLGVEVVLNDRVDTLYSIDGLSVRGPANFLPLTALPAIAWEPMYDLSSGDASVDDNTLLHPPGDGPLTQVRANSATLIPISPLQSLQAVLDAGAGGSDATLTLPFGMIAFLDTDTTAGDGTSVLPTVTLVQPVFAATDTPGGSVYTGAWQLSFAAPDPTDPDPVLAGRTYLRTEDDNPYPGYSYGEQVLGADVADIFSSRFNPPEGDPDGTGVPLRRYDLTGYGASTFSEWSNITNPAPTDVIKAFFHVLIGRTSHEVIQVQSIVYPWAIKVVRTITIDRLASGPIHRYDSGWQAASDGLFEFPAATGITRDQIHSGLISGVINVKNIQQLGLPIQTNGTPDILQPGDPVPNPAPKPMPIAVQPITFDADVIIQPQHQVVQGGATLNDLSGTSCICVPSKSITGYIGLEYKYHLSLLDMVAFPLLQAGAGGAIRATLNVGGANSLLRATEFDATPIHDQTPGGGIGIVCAVRGLPKLSSDGAWSVAARKQTQAAPVPLGPLDAAPLVQPNDSGTSNPGNDIHFANPSDIFRLAAGAPTPPTTLYGFLQATGSQSNFLSRPILTVGSDKLTLGDALNVAHAGALLGAISKFPGISQCLQFLGNELDDITNQLAAPSLSTTQNLQLKPGVRTTPLNLINISIAKVDLYFHWQEDNLNQPADPASVVIALGQPTDPSWSLDVNHIAIGLTIPALSAQPVIWLQGNFHADADTTPAFPDLKVDFAGPLDPLTKFFTVLQDIASVLSPGGGASAQAMPADDDDDDDSPGLDVHFADGKLTVTDNFSLPSIPLGPGTLDDVSLDIGASLDILSLSVGFGVSIGTKEAPCHWIVDPLSGTIAIGAGVKNNAIDVFILAGIGLGLAIDLGIASGSASIVIALSLEINGSQITIMLLLTGQAQVDVLGGLASASISITCGLGLSFPLAIPPPNVTMIGTASVGIHISICWVVNINFSGSWTFQKNVPLHQLT